MILDKQEEFSDSQSIAFAAGNAISTNVIDTLLIQKPFDINQVAGPSGQTLTGTVGTKDLGIGEPIWFIVQMDTTLAGATATLVVTLESSDVVALTTPTVHYTSPTLTVGNALLTAGATVAAFLLPSGAYKRFLGVRYTIAVATTTAGNISAFLVRNIQKNTLYPEAYTVG